MDTDHYSELEEIVQRQENVLNGSHEELIECIRTMKEELNSIVGKVEEERVSTSDLYTKTKEHLDAVRNTMHAQDSRVEDSEKEREQLNNRISELIEQNDGYQSRIDALTQALAEQEQRCSTMETELDEKQSNSAETEEAQERIQDLEKQLADVSEQAVDTEKTLRRIEKLETALTEQAEVVEAGQAAKRKLAELEVSAKGYKKAAKEEKKKNDKLSSQVAELEGQLNDSAAVQHKMDESESKNQQLNEQLEALTHDNENLQNDLSSVLNDLQASKDETNESNATLEKLENHLGELREANDSNESLLNKNKLEMDQLADTIQTLEEEVKTASANEEEAKNLIESHEKENQTIQESLDALNDLPQKVAGLESALENAEQQLSQAQSELDDERAQGTKSVLAEQLSLALKDKDESKTEVQQLQQRINELETELRTKIEKPSQEPTNSDEPEIATLNETPDAAPSTESDNLSFMISDERVHLGYLLLESGVVTQEQLDEAIQVQKEGSGQDRIGQIFVSLGFATEEVVAQAIAHQINGRFVRINEYPIQRETANLISDRLAEMHACVPLAIEGDRLVVAMTNPLDLIAIEDLERSTEFTVEPVVATSSDIRKLAKEYYYS